MTAEPAYTTMRDAIAKAGRPMLFSICEWGMSKPWEWAAQGRPFVAHHARYL